jgi:hypothetical protein
VIYHCRLVWFNSHSITRRTRCTPPDKLSMLLRNEGQRRPTGVYWGAKTPYEIINYSLDEHTACTPLDYCGVEIEFVPISRRSDGHVALHAEYVNSVLGVSTFDFGACCPAPADESENREALHSTLP